MKNETSILVTGGAGYIGSHTTHQLVDAGYNVVVVDNLYSGHRWAIPDTVKFYEGDCGNRKLISEIMDTHEISAVVHFAGHIVVPESVSNPIKYYQNNVVGSVNLIQCCIEREVGQFIFSSSAAVYGNPETVPADESTPTKPITPYGTTKLITEWTLADAANSSENKSDFRYVALRYFNVAGAQVAGHLGQSTPEATHLIKVACEAACDKRPEMMIYGTDYPTDDGTCVRDYIHVDDLAAAHLRALEYLQQGGDCEILNCGYGRGFSVREVVDKVKAVSGIDFRAIESERRPGDPHALIADSQRIRKTLGWQPQYDDLELICRTAYEWERKLT